MAALVVDANSSNITIKDFNIVNSVPVMVTQGEKDACITPNKESNGDVSLPTRDNLVVCEESTSATTSDEIDEALALSNSSERIAACDALTDLTAENSAYLVRSSAYNERGHAIAILGDMITLDGVRARGNQDSIYISSGRIYFHGCDLIGGTDYIYGDATAVFDSCKLGAEGMTDKDYPTTITATNTDASNPYGYLFWNCTVYNVLDNITGGNVFGRPWRQDAQVTFYNTKLDDTKEIGASAASISDNGWSDMSDNTKEAARFYEYGTYNASGTAVDLSGRVVRDDGFGSVLDKWQILEFNPRNYFNSSYHMDKGRSEWDPMNFGVTYLSEVDAQIAAASVSVPADNSTSLTLPTSGDESVEFHWVSDSANAVVSDDDTTLTLIRPAYGENDVSATLTLYARNKDEYQYGDKKEIEITIRAYTTTENSGSVAGTITLGKSYTEDKTFTLEFSESDALVKSATITVPAGTTSYDYTVENIPVGTYDIALVTDDNMKTTLSSETVSISDSTASTLNIDAYTVVDKTITYDEDVNTYVTSSSIDLLKDFSSTDIENLKSSDEVTVKYTIHADEDTLNPSSASYALGIIDLMGADPGSSESDSNNKDQRYIKTRVHSWWYQIDMIDGSLAGFDGSSNISGQQILNVAGKFKSYSGGVDYEIELVIDYANGVITENSIGTATSDGTTVGSSSFEFTTIPSNIDRGVLKLGLYNEKLLVYTLSDISVTFEEKETDEDTSATATPEPTATATVAPSLSASDWIYDDDENSSVTVTDDAYTLAYASSSGSGFSYDLTDVIENAPASISTSEGVYTVEFDLNVPKYNGDMFVDISGTSTIPGWNPGTSGTNMYGRLAGNSSWSTVRYCGGNSATTNAGYTSASQVSGEYVHVVFTIDMSDKANITISYNGDEQTISGFASEITDELYLNIQPSASGAVTAYVKNITATYTAASEPTATPVPTATTEPDRTITWTANNLITNDYTVTEANGVYTFDVASGKSVNGALWSADLSAWLDGYSYGDMDTLTFSFDFMIESEDNRPSADGYIDLSTGTSYSYSDTDNARISRYNIYNGWDQFNYYGATSTRTNGGLKFNDYLGKWYTLVTTVDLINKTVSTTTTVDGKSATYNIATADFATALVDNKLYLNVMPTRYDNDSNEVKFSIANIDVGYTLIFGDSETDSGLYYKDGDTSTLYGVIRFLQALEKATEVDSYGFVFCDSDGTILDKNTNSIVSTESGEIEGFYGDIYDISADNYNETGATAYAKAFVVINGVYYYSPAFSGTVDSSSGIVTYSEPE